MCIDRVVMGCDGKNPFIASGGISALVVVLCLLIYVIVISRTHPDGNISIWDLIKQESVTWDGFIASFALSIVGIFVWLVAAFIARTPQGKEKPLVGLYVFGLMLVLSTFCLYGPLCVKSSWFGEICTTHDWFGESWAQLSAALNALIALANGVKYMNQKKQPSADQQMSGVVVQQGGA